MTGIGSPHEWGGPSGVETDRALVQTAPKPKTHDALIPSTSILVPMGLQRLRPRSFGRSEIMTLSIVRMRVPEEVSVS